jgi:hypothetical protein
MNEKSGFEVYSARTCKQLFWFGTELVPHWLQLGAHLCDQTMAWHGFIMARQNVLRGVSPLLAHPGIKILE